MTDEMTIDDVAATIAKAKQPRVMKQPTKDELRLSLSECRAAFEGLNNAHTEAIAKLNEFDAAFNRLPRWLRPLLTRKPK